MKTLSTDTILIIPNGEKKNKLLEHTMKKQMNYTKYMSLEELFSHLTLQPKKEAIYYLMKDLHFSYALSKIYLKNIPHITNIVNSHHENVKKLLEIKQYLEKNKLLEDHTFFFNYLKGKEIQIEGYMLTKEQKNFLDRLEDTQIHIKKTLLKSYTHPLYAFETISDEIAFVASDIAQKLQSGISIHHIYLTNVTEEYEVPLHRIFHMYGIPLVEDTNHTLYGNPIAQEWLQNLENKEQSFEMIGKKLKTEEDWQIYNQLLQIYNSYLMIPKDEYWRICIEEACRETSIILPKKQCAVQIKNLRTTTFQSDDYVYFLGMNQENIPVTKQDEDFLSDTVCESLNIDTTKDKNRHEKTTIIQKIQAIPNAILTYKKKTPFGTYYPSSILSYLTIEEKIPIKSYQYADTWNQIELAKALDCYTQYNEKSDNLEFLYAHYPNILYNTYNNQYTQIPKEQLKTYLENKLVLSYTSLERFNRCSFRYYISNILKLDTKQETFAQEIGNLFHYILSVAFQDSFDFETEWEKYHQNKIYNAKETFFLKKLKQELLFVIDTIKEQNTHSELIQEEYEQKIFKSISGNLKITFMGIVDKIKYKEENGVVYATIIDYKTGTLETHLNHSIYGIEIQLPVYLYLLKNKPGFEKVKVLGFYLQKMIQNEICNDENKDYNKMKKDNMRLEGYSIDQPEMVCKFDDTYQNSRVIKGMKISQKGFYAYSKVMCEEKMDQLVQLVEEKIKEAANKIENAEFSINPKQIGNKLIGCEFCTYHDLCFRKSRDLVYLKEYKNLEFLGDE